MPQVKNSTSGSTIVWRLLLGSRLLRGRSEAVPPLPATSMQIPALEGLEHQLGKGGLLLSSRLGKELSISTSVRFKDSYISRSLLTYYQKMGTPIYHGLLGIKQYESTHIKEVLKKNLQKINIHAS